MKKQFTQYKLLLGLASLLVFFSCVPKTSAQTSSLSISPSVFRIEAKPPADVWTPFTLRNLSDQPVTLKIGYKVIDPFASSNGNVVFSQDGALVSGQDKKIFDKIQIVDDQNISHDTIDLGPKQSMRLRLRILLPANEQASDYYFSLVFLQNTNQIDQSIQNANVEDQRSYSTLQEGIGATVLLAVGPKQAPVGLIQIFSTPWFFDKGPVPFTLSVHNSGLHFMTPHGQIMIKNIFGQTVGKVTVPPETILAGTERNFFSANGLTNATTAFATGDNTQTPQTLVWNENFLLGVYTATLTLTLSDNGPVYVRSITFIAFPVVFIIQLVIVLLVIWYIYLRVKRKISF